MIVTTWILDEVFGLAMLSHIKKDLDGLLHLVVLWSKANKGIHLYHHFTLPWYKQCHEFDPRRNPNKGQSPPQFTKKILYKHNQIRLIHEIMSELFNCQSMANRERFLYPIRCQINVNVKFNVYICNQIVILMTTINQKICIAYRIKCDDKL